MIKPSNDIPKLFSGVQITDLRTIAQRMLNANCTVIAEHKGTWSNAEVEKLATDAYSYFMQLVAEKGIIVRMKE